MKNFFFFPQMKSLVVLGILFSLTSSLPAGGATWYVNDNSTTGDVYTTAVGNDANAGTAAAPFLTIGKAIMVASNGDIILVDVGTYPENITLGKSLTINGAQAGVNACGRSANESLISASGVLLTLVSGAAGSVIDGFTFSGGTRSMESMGGPLDNLTIRNNRLIGFTNAGIFLNDPGTDVTLHQNSVDGASKTGGGALVHLDTDGFNGFYLTNNCISNGLTGTGFFVDGNHNVGPSGARTPLISGNTISFNNTGMNLGSRAFGSFTVPNAGTISNNTFSNNNFDGLQGGMQHTLISQNQFNNNGRSGLALTSFGNMNADRGAQNSDIQNNFFLNNLQEDVLFSSTQAPGTISTNTLNNNSHLSTKAITYDGAENIDATCNWYGSASPNFAIKISGASVNYTPWLTNGTDNEAGTPGFQPVPGSCVGGLTLGEALDFDGSNDYVSAPGVNLSNQSFTIEFWQKRNTPNGSSDYFVGQGTFSTNVGLHIGFRPTNEFTFAFYNNDLNTVTYTDTDWHHWACVYQANGSGTDRWIYRDGVLVASDNASANYTGTGNIILGAGPWFAIFGDNSHMNGLLDEVRVWNRALCEAEIQAGMNCELSGGETGLIAYYNFNQGIASGNNPGVTTLMDQAGGDNNGTLQNFALAGSTSNWIAPGAVTTGSTCASFIDNTPPTITCPLPLTLEWIAGFNTQPVPPNTPQDPSVAPANTGGMATATDDCSPPVAVGFSDVLAGPTPANCPNLWVLTRTFTATDAANNTASCTQLITFTDNTPPVITCPPPVTMEWPAGFPTQPPVGQPNQPLHPSVAPPLTGGSATATDNCGTPAIMFKDSLVGPSPANCPNLWVLYRIWKATDACGNMSTCVQAITMTDNTPPVITCPPTASVEWPSVFNMQPVGPNTPQDPSVVPANTGGPATATDNCGSPAITYQDVLTGPTPANCPNLWKVTRIWKATDACGNMSTCTQIINLTDFTPPTALCQGVGPINLDASGNATITPAQVNNGSSDNCGTPAVSVTPSAFDCGDIGANTVVLTATDNCGNTATCSATVTINPFVVITEPVAVTHETCAGAGDGTITITATTLGGTLGYSVNGGNSFQFTNVFTSLSPGTYNIVVKAFGTTNCMAMATAEVMPGNSPQVWYKDADGDGYTNGVTQTACTQPLGYVASADPGDCDDNDALQHPGQTWYKDTDGDGYSNGTNKVQCTRPTGYKAAGELTGPETDCNDSNSGINPAATEVCNSLDDDCNGLIDNGAPDATFVGNKTFTSQAQVNAWPACYNKIQGNLTIQGSGITSLGPLANLEEVTGTVTIKLSGLDDLTGLNGLTTVGGALLVFSNNAGGILSSLDGLESVLTVGGNLWVYYNYSLTDCCAIYDLINENGSHSVGGSISIHHNDTGCDNVTEINTDCGNNNLLAPPMGNNQAATATGLEEKLSMEVFPNPASEVITVLIYGEYHKGSLRLMDVTGRIVSTMELEENTGSVQLEVEHLLPGLYMVAVQLDGGKPLAQRIVVE